VEGKGWVDAEDLRTGDRVRQADGTTGVVWLKWTVYRTQEMYNLTVDTAHTFFVGEGQWLVHNTCRDLSGNLTDDVVGNGLVREAQAYLSSLDGAYRRTVIAVGQAGNTKIVTAWAGTNPRGLAQLEKIASARGVTYVPPSGRLSAGHAEQVAYRWLSGLPDIKIGISRAQGLCPDCDNFFRKRNFFDVFYPY